MSDGHLNKCVDCSKRDAKTRRTAKAADPEWVVLEAQRQREKQAKARRLGTACISGKEKRADVLREAYFRYPDKSKARTALNNALRDGKVFKQNCLVCGSIDSEAHHPDYSKPFDVIWLCPKHHAEEHVKENDILRRKKALSKVS